MTKSMKQVRIMGFIQLKNVQKHYKMGEVIINAVDDVSFEIEKGDFAVVVGASGAGKTTVLNILGGMDSLDGGSILVDDEDISTYNRKMLTEYRRFEIGFVFQFYNLVQNLTARENVELASQISRDPLDVDLVLEKVGLSDRKDNFPSQLSGGEQQRVAIARALAKNPKLLLCDEPTGALDYQTGKSILKLLQDTCVSTGMTVVMITHNAALIAMANKVIRMKNGKVTEITVNKKPLPVEGIEW
jgi:putative ABC transport system ATP-binding protein